MSGAMPGVITADERSVPCGEVTSTRSPVPIPSLAAVAGIHLHPAAPHRGGQRVRHLLQPRQVGGGSVVEGRRRVRQEVEGELRRVAVELRLDERRRGRARAGRRSRRRGRRGARATCPTSRPSPAPRSTHRRPRQPAAARRRWRRARPPSIPRGGRAASAGDGRRPAARRRSPASGAAAPSPAAPRWPQPRASPTPARAPPTIPGTSDRAGSGRRGRWSRPGSCRS